MTQVGRARRVRHRRCGGPEENKRPTRRDLLNRARRVSFCRRKQAAEQRLTELKKEYGSKFDILAKDGHIEIPRLAQHLV